MIGPSDPADRQMPPPGAVLFACNFNQVRSVMAFGLTQLYYRRQVFVDSCGVRPAPVSREADPFVIAVMEELGLDLTGFRSKTFEDLEDTSFDLVVSLTPEAQHKAVELARTRAIDLEYWPTIDPTLTEGSRELRLTAYRVVRDSLLQRITAKLGRASTFGG